MPWLYFISVRCYFTLLRLAACCHPGAAAWVAGRKNLLNHIRQTLEKESSFRIWIHCASLGEYEQAVPLIQRLKERFPSARLVLTFFSPSGYEQRKNNSLAHHVFYLPDDSPAHAKEFLDIVSPRMALFIKYEYWYFYLRELHQRHIPVYFISARFRQGHPFFRWYGAFFRQMLTMAHHLFLQDDESYRLCLKHGITRCSVSGDTRFDRVLQIASQPWQSAIAEAFCSGFKIFIAGSTWPDDENLLLTLIHQRPEKWKFIVAPHQIHENRIRRLEASIHQKTVRYSEWNHNTDAMVLIIDNIGLLALLYRYGTIAYVGGGFGKGLHNILEPAAYDLPVIFGKQIGKNPEAAAMIAGGTGFAINNKEELLRTFEKLNHEERLATLRSMQQRFMKAHSGATERIMMQMDQDRSASFL
jgi:3-deoxy-D-manno-octulosonic-acid transferase